MAGPLTQMQQDAVFMGCGCGRMTSCVGAPQVSLTAPNCDHFAPVSLTLI